MNKLYFKGIDKFIKYKKIHFPKIQNQVNTDLKFREDAEYNDLKERLERHNILQRIDGLETHSIDEEKKLIIPFKKNYDWFQEEMEKGVQGINYQ